MNFINDVILLNNKLIVKRLGKRYEYKDYNGTKQFKHQIIPTDQNTNFWVGEIIKSNSINFKIGEIVFGFTHNFEAFYKVKEDEEYTSEYIIISPENIDAIYTGDKKELKDFDEEITIS